MHRQAWSAGDQRRNVQADSHIACMGAGDGCSYPEPRGQRGSRRRDGIAADVGAPRPGASRGTRTNKTPARERELRAGQDRQQKGGDGGDQLDRRLAGLSALSGHAPTLGGAGARVARGT